jgi:hypothetical protein
MYQLSAHGIARGFANGQALLYVHAAYKLARLYPEHVRGALVSVAEVLNPQVLLQHGLYTRYMPSQENGVAHMFLGGYHLAAPWPLRSLRKAREAYLHGLGGYCSCSI